MYSNKDYRIEFLDYIIAVKVVDSLDDAIAHIQKYSTGHSECIVTSDYNSPDTMAKCRIGTAKFFTLLLLLYHTLVKSQGMKQLMAN